MTIGNIKISELQNIGGNLNYQSVFPIDDQLANPVTTKKGNLQIVGNYILSQAGGGNFVQAAQATLAQSVVNSAQPNITSVGTLSNLVTTGNITLAGNITIAGPAPLVAINNTITHKVPVKINGVTYYIALTTGQ